MTWEKSDEQHKGTILSAAALSTLNRPSDPVVLTGALIPSLKGISPNDLAAFKYGDSWQQIPVQVDERVNVDLGKVYNSSPVGLVVLTYADSNTWTGPDSDPMLDDDDEIAFMAKDAGNQPLSFSEPAGVIANSGIEVKITDPLDTAQTGYVYLFRQAGGLDPAAGKNYVQYNFVLLSGNYKTTYKLSKGPNPEASSASSAYYRLGFIDRWINNELRIKAGGATGVDIFDREKVGVAPNNCFRSETTFSKSRGAFIVNKSGPVRGIRAYLGANSGPYTQRQHVFYERRQDLTLYHRVHEIGSSFNFFDYSPEGIGLKYYNNVNPGGVIIDGAPDVVATKQAGWEMVVGLQGSMVMSNRIETDIPSLAVISYYLDDETPSQKQCTGDSFAYGISGPWALGIPCTDPTKPLSSCPNPAKLTGYRTIYYESPGLAVSDAQQKDSLARNPLTFTFVLWR